MDKEELSNIISGRTVAKVEHGTTPGWVVIHFGSDDLRDDEGKPVTLFLTMCCGGDNARNQEERHWATVALHVRYHDGWKDTYNVRDKRDPEMPIAASYKLLHKEAQ
jgi:hypothetical protein